MKSSGSKFSYLFSKIEEPLLCFVDFENWEAFLKGLRSEML